MHLTYILSWFSTWFGTTNHKRIGLLYLLTGGFIGILSVLLSVIIRLELAFPGHQLLFGQHHLYNDIVTMHGVLCSCILTPCFKCSSRHTLQRNASTHQTGAFRCFGKNVREKLIKPTPSWLDTFRGSRWLQTLVLMLFILLLSAILGLLQLGQESQRPITDVFIQCISNMGQYREWELRIPDDVHYTQAAMDYALDCSRIDPNWVLLNKCCCVMSASVSFFLSIWSVFNFKRIGSPVYVYWQNLVFAFVFFVLSFLVLLDAYSFWSFSVMNYEDLELQSSKLHIIDYLCADARLKLTDPTYHIGYDWFDRYTRVKSELDQCVWKTPEVRDKMKLLAEYAAQLRSKE